MPRKTIIGKRRGSEPQDEREQFVKSMPMRMSASKIYAEIISSHLQE